MSDYKNIKFTTKNYAVTYYQTLEEVHWHLGLEISKNGKKI